MAKRNTTTHHTRARAKQVARGGTSVRKRVRALSVETFRGRDLSLHGLSQMVHDVLTGAVEAVDAGIPKAKGNVLREVFDGLSEGVHALASAGSGAVSDARAHGRNIKDKAAPQAARRIRAANDEFLGAVKSFAGRTTDEVRGELYDLVARAERTGPKVTGAARKSTRAAGGRVDEMPGELARTGVRMAREGAQELAKEAGGLLDGVSEALGMKEGPRTRRPSRKAAVARPGEKPRTQTVKKKAKRKVVKALKGVQRGMNKGLNKAVRKVSRKPPTRRRRA
jgi:hypothetical protein